MPHRRRHDLPRLPRAAAPSLLGKAADRGLLDLAVHDLRRVDRRRAPHRRRRPVRRRPRHGHAARALGPGAGRGAPRRAPGWSCRRRRGSRSPRRPRRPGPPSPGWSSPAAATRASTSGSPTRAASDGPVSEVSIGDYVLAGGEVAVLVMVEAVDPAAARRPRQRRVGARPTRTPTACSRARPTPGRRRGAATTSPRCCSPATTRAIARWRRGGVAAAHRGPPSRPARRAAARRARRRRPGRARRWLNGRGCGRPRGSSSSTPPGACCSSVRG